MLTMSARHSCARPRVLTATRLAAIAVAAALVCATCLAGPAVRIPTTTAGVKKYVPADFHGLADHPGRAVDLPCHAANALAYANRYIDVLPHAHSRVHLQALAGNPCSTYINADYVHGYDGTPGWYIATQGPLPGTVEDFWRMVWEQDTRAIVMTTRLSEQGRVKCEPYWAAPEAGHGPGASMNRGAPFHAGGFLVTTTSSKRVNDYVFSQFNVTRTSRSRGGQ